MTRHPSTLGALVAVSLSLAACSKERPSTPDAVQPQDTTSVQTPESPGVTPKRLGEDELPAKVALARGDTAKYRLEDGSVAEAALIERWVDDATKVVHVALGGVVVLTERERDSPVVHVLSAPGKPSVIAIETSGGGPGTCVWMKEVRAFLVADLATFANDQDAPKGKAVELGGYLDCEDGTRRSCGCGTWEATWRATFEGGDELEFTTEPKTTYRSEGKAPVAAPKGLKIRVPAR